MAAPVRLVDVLRALPESELNGLIRRLGITIDPQKRLDVPNQVARALVSQPDVRDPSHLPPASVDLLQRLTEARGRLLLGSLPPGLEPLAAKGIVYARMSEGAYELMLPSAFQVQFKVFEREDPRGIRALLVQASFETCSAVASFYLGRPATPPLPLSLEPAWEALVSPERLEEEVRQLPPLETRLLEAIEREGGEVVTEELLDLEREPMRLRTASGAAPSRRGAGFSLERRGFLIPIHPNRHAIPSEVAALIGRSARHEREANRERVRASVLGGDYLPRRARFAEDPAPLAAAVAMTIRESSEIRAGLGLPRTLSVKLSQRFGRDAQRVSMLVALARAAGLWGPAALSASAPPGSWPLRGMGAALFQIWRTGSAWDEAREIPEVYRLPPESREPSPAGQLRELLLDALRELGEGRWVPWQALAVYIRDDRRTAGIARLLRRWAERQSVPCPDPVDVARRMTFESLHGLGVLDLGDADSESDDEAAVRLTSRGRAFLQGSRPPAGDRSHFIDDETLFIGSSTPLSALMHVVPIVDIGKISDHIELSVSQTTVSRALSLGLDGEHLKARLEAIAPLPEPLAQLFSRAGQVLARGRIVPTSGFLWLDDEVVRDMLLSRRQTAELFVDPSPAGGLLVAPGVEIEKLVRRCRALGVEILQDGHVLRAHSITMAPPAVEPAQKRRSVPPRRGSLHMRSSLAVWVLVGALQGCQRPEGPPAGDGPAAPPSSPALPSSSAPAAQAPAPASAQASAQASAPAAPAASAPTVQPRCCRLDRTEGFFGPEKGINARYSGDVLLRNDGEKLLFPQDLINDTKELYMFAKSAGKSLYQERRLRVVSEGPRYLSVEVEDRGETGATTPFFHSKCVTVDVKKGKTVKLEEALAAAQAGAAVDEGKRRFAASPGQDRYRFVATSFVLSPGSVRFCCSPRDDRQPTPRLDIEVPLPPGETK